MNFNNLHLFIFFLIGFFVFRHENRVDLKSIANHLIAIVLMRTIRKSHKGVYKYRHKKKKKKTRQNTNVYFLFISRTFYTVF